MVTQQKWYVVTVGKKPGVYSSWIEAAANIRNIPGGPIYQSFPSEEKAYRVFNAALARGEVRAYPNVKSDLDEPIDNAPLSPLGGEAALLRTPMKLEEDARLTGSQTPVSYSRVAQLRRTLQHSSDASPTSSSPATHVTQVNPSMYVDDDDMFCSTPVLRLPHLTFDSGSESRAYPSISGCAQFQLDVSDGSSSATDQTPRSMRLGPESPSRRKGVKYRGLPDLEERENLDARIWHPKSPMFNPDRVKRWPKSRSPSPTKWSAPLPSDDGDNVALAEASFVRAGRGRHAKLTPSLSLPGLPNRELEEETIGSRPAQARGSPAKIAYSLSDSHLAERKNYTESHAQTVPCEGGSGQNSIVVHCSASCVHGGVIHVPQRGMAPDLDVRSPISKGTLVPLSAETLFGRPSPKYHSCDA